MQSVRQQRQSGFTLLELVAVIIVIGILAAVAVPKMGSLRSDAALGATQGVAGALGSASATNFAVRTAFPTKGGAVANCTDIGGALVLQGGLPAGYSINSTAITAGSAATCTVNGGSGTTATFVGYGIL